LVDFAASPPFLLVSGSGLAARGRGIAGWNLRRRFYLLVNHGGAGA